MKHKITRDVMVDWGKRTLAPFVLLLLFMLTIEVYNVWTGLSFKAYLARRLMVSFGLGLLIFGPSALMRRSVRSIYLVITTLLLAILFTTHFTFIQYAGGYLSISSLRYLWQLPTVGGSVASLLRPELLFFATLPIAAVILGFYDRASVGLVRLGLLAKLIGISIILVVSGSMYGYLFVREAQSEGDVTRLIYHPYNSDLLMQKIGVINYTIFDGIKYASRKRSLDKKEVAYVQEVGPKVTFKPAGDNLRGVARGKNLIYIQLESFQYYLINKKVNGVELTPNLNRLANNGINFTNFHYMTGAGTSSDAEFVALNSLFNLGDRATVFEYPSNSFQALPSLLREQGYSTVAMHGDSKNFWNRANTYPGFGYQRYYSLEDYKPSEEKIAWGINDVDFFHESLEKLQNVKQPYFAHLISLSSHIPFDVPEKYHDIDLSSYDLPWIQENYIWATRYTDLALGKFINELEASGQAKEAVIVITGDHEPFVVRGNDLNFARFLGYENGFTELNYLHSRQVPFILYAPGILQPSSVSDPASHMDVYPTLTNLFGIQTPASVLGRDLLNNPNPVFTRRTRTAGVGIEAIVTKSLTYLSGANNSQFEAGSCYRGDKLTALDDCRKMFEEQQTRVRISDLVLEGNRLDLLR